MLLHYRTDIGSIKFYVNFSSLPFICIGFCFSLRALIQNYNFVHSYRAMCDLSVFSLYLHVYWTILVVYYLCNIQIIAMQNELSECLKIYVCILYSTIKKNIYFCWCIHQSALAQSNIICYCCFVFAHANVYMDIPICWFSSLSSGSRISSLCTTICSSGFTAGWRGAVWPRIFHNETNCYSRFTTMHVCCFDPSIELTIFLVDSSMAFQCKTIGKCCCTNFTFEWLFAAVHLSVILQMGCLAECWSACLAPYSQTKYASNRD